MLPLVLIILATSERKCSVVSPTDEMSYSHEGLLVCL